MILQLWIKRRRKDYTGSQDAKRKPTGLRVTERNLLNSLRVWPPGGGSDLLALFI